jgi:hypothetical protein
VRETCGYYPPASKKALLRSLREHGTPMFRDARMRPCGKPATHVADPVATTPASSDPLYLCPLHAMHNAGRGYKSKRIDHPMTDDRAEGEG